MSETWWPPREIIFTQAQILWLIPYLPMLKEGQYPSSSNGSGYTEIPGGKHTRGHKAPFETPCEIYAELSARLDRCGVDGKLLVAEVNAENWYLSDESRRALNYISGWKRKDTPYAQWKASRRYYYKNIRITKT